jgi:hypothetical protein
VFAPIESSLAELGQLAIVEMFLPLAYVLRTSWTYQRLVLVSGSLGIAALALAHRTGARFQAASLVATSRMRYTHQILATRLEWGCT